MKWWLQGIDQYRLLHSVLEREHGKDVILIFKVTFRTLEGGFALAWTSKHSCDDTADMFSAWTSTESMAGGSVCYAGEIEKGHSSRQTVGNTPIRVGLQFF